MSSLTFTIPYHAMPSHAKPSHASHALLNSILGTAHLPICWPQVVYASLEPMVHKYVRDLRAPQNGYSEAIQKWQDMVVFMRVVTKEHAEVRRRDIAWNRVL